MEALLGIEGSAARVYFSEFAGMLKASEEVATLTTANHQSLRSILRCETGVPLAIR
jgi:hypothetical protein